MGHETVIQAARATRDRQADDEQREEDPDGEDLGRVSGRWCLIPDPRPLCARGGKLLMMAARFGDPNIDMVSPVPNSMRANSQ